MPLDFTEYKVLSFDIYGTLINWETGIYEALLERLGESEVERSIAATSAAGLRRDLLSMYAKEERKIQREFPTLSYQSVLSEVYNLICERLEVPADQDKALSFGRTIAEWPAFSDTVDAIKILSKHYKLVALTNVDESSFNGTMRAHLYGLKFDAVYTAAAIGSYKPAVRNFEYLIKHVGTDFRVGKGQILHVAHSLLHDHVPAKKVGLRPGVYIERRGERAAMSGDVEGLLKSGKVEFGARFKTLRLFAEAVEKAFSKGG